MALTGLAMLVASAAQAQIPVVAAPPETLIPKQEPAYFIERLQNADEPVWREGQVGLAMSGERGLAELEKLIEKNPDPELRKRVRGLILVGMLTTIRWDDLKRRPQLGALVLKEVLAGMEIAKELVGRAEADAGQTGFSDDSRRFSVRLHEKADGHEATRMERFKQLSGGAVPAMQWLCTHKLAICRAQGLLLIEHLDATVCRPDIEKLKTDEAKVPLLQGPMMASGVRGTTLGERARRSEEQFKIMSCLTNSIEKHLTALLKSERSGAADSSRGLSGAALSYAMREIPDGLPSDVHYKRQLAITWDEWWKGARAVWKEYHAMHGPTAGWEEKQRWNNWLGRRTYRREVEITGSGVATNKLSVAEPVGGHCKITEDGKVIAEGPIPLATDRRAKREYPHGGFKIEATAPGCRPWWVFVPSHNGQTVVIRFYKDFLD